MLLLRKYVRRIEPFVPMAMDTFGDKETDIEGAALPATL